MKTELNLSVSPQEANEESLLKTIVAEKTQTNETEINAIKIIKRLVDARSRNIKIDLKVDVYTNELPLTENYSKGSPTVTSKPPVIIVGAGPAGLFAALRLIELGLKPIIIERGKDVKSRRRDLAAINKLHIVNPDSNYCFGEGGAGTYSDGKLYTRSTKRGDVNKILTTLVSHGASEEILINAHPHIGTNKLPKIIVNIRESIVNAGGEIHFNTRLTDFIISNNEIKGIRVLKKEVKMNL